MKNNKVLFLASFLLIIIVFVAGCSEESSGGDAESNTTQEITYASTSDVVGLSPIDTNDSVSSNATFQIYETLFIKDPETMEIQPLLAESYETPDDNTWEIKLKEDITFHDGTPFNAEAVKYTFEQIKDPERAAPRASLLAPIDTIEVKDEYTVVLKTKEPYGPMLSALSHTNAAIVSPTADKEGDINKEPVGTGPFTFVEWAEGAHVTLEKNEDYWREPAQLDKVTFKVVPESSTAISMLETGEVQFLDALPSDQLPRIESLNDVEVQKSEGTRVSYLGFNMEKEPFNELEFRQAIAYGVNQEAYVEQLNGLGIFNESIIGPKVFGYNEEASEATYSYDKEKAEQMIEENGYSGQSITLLAANRDNYMKMAEIVQSQLTEIGLDVQIETMEWGTFLDTTRKGNYEMTFLGWSNSTADGSELLYPNLHTDNINASNYSRYNNEEFDKLVEESRMSVDQDYRKEKLHEANLMAIEDAPWIVMEHGMVTAAYHTSVEGLIVDPTGSWSLYNVSRK
ncbi:glutathione ABC transporter substrate-binding protein [Virgibacillus profundi]|uniref:Glutathione ABC transporter substrate-binding protein n=1 Tax=Virgibacillus profundi TaxID=2024555 RepID=A0A2A2IGX3_9BACI|nr:glutathione ABC transporter substrate-binding protein [Virgibacillus profundi]PAV30782.1 glutathione ABC transporter substrate-binding protein [Virgibacillus profundi]PXY54965.1 glutathione ABC transporter substrate-binding protein [Virgibacillus profundi]